MAMTKEHKCTLQGNHVMFVENLILSEELLAVLVQENVLTTSLLEKIEAGKTRSERVRELIFTLIRRSDKAYTVFLQALVESRQDHLAKLLDSSIAEQFIKERDEKEKEDTRPVQVEARSFSISWQPGDQCVDEADAAWYDKLFNTNTRELGVDLRQMSSDRQNSIAEMMKSKKAYYLTKKDGYFGRAVIINNRDYYTLQPRPGSDADCENLKKLFVQLHFDTDVHTDLTSEEMQQILTNERDNPMQHEYSSFVLCILAHGSENKVYGIEGKEDKGSIDIKEITNWFGTVNCPGLAGKPKLFFIQACQGGKDMIAVTINKAKVLEKSTTVHRPQSDGDQLPRAVKVNHSQPLPDAHPGTVSQPQQQTFDESPSNILHTPEVADVLVAYSTAPGYKSWRHSEYGTWFVRCLIYVILNNACEDHVLDMLTQVAFIISHFKVDHGRGFAVQIPQVVSTLRKKVYFIP